MDDEVITWNLKGPKKMKKRRELNALLRNSSKYTALRRSTDNAVENSAGGGPGCVRLLTGSNMRASSSDNERNYYFSANKTIVREKQRSRYFKIFRRFFIGLIVAFSFFVAILLIVSYAKFQHILSDLKVDLQVQNDQTESKLSLMKGKLSDVDLLFKQYSEMDTRISLLEKKLLENRGNKTGAKSSNVRRNLEARDDSPGPRPMAAKRNLRLATRDTFDGIQNAARHASIQQ